MNFPQSYSQPNIIPHGSKGSRLRDRQSAMMLSMIFAGAGRTL